MPNRRVMDSLLDSPSKRIVDRYVESVCRDIHGPILDVGAGKSRYRYLFPDYTSLDIKGSEGIDIIADARHLPFREESFTSVICTAVLEHIENPWNVVHEIGRALRKEGFLLLWLPFIQPRHDIPHDFLRFTEEGVRTLVRDSCSGLEIKNLIPCGGFFSTLAGIWWWPFTYFFQKNKIIALCILPAYLAFILLSALDRFDYEHRFSLGYIVTCGKIEDSNDFRTISRTDNSTQ